MSKNALYIDPATIERPWVFTAEFQGIYQKAKKRMFWLGILVGGIAGLGIGRLFL